MTRLLVDTGVLYALVDPSDQYHARAQREARLLEAGGAEVLLAYPLLLESYSLVLQRLGRRVAGRWLGEVGGSFGLMNVTGGDYRTALEMVRRYHDRALSLFDATLAVLAERLDLMIWTFDSHFDMLRANVWRDWEARKGL